MTGSGGREGAGRGTSELGGKRKQLISLKETLSNTHECGQDKVLKCGLCEPPVALPSFHAALCIPPLTRCKENIIPGL